MEHREEMVSLYKPKVLDLLRRMVIVHNYYADEKISEGTIEWIPGNIEIPQDPQELANRYAAEIAAGVSTAADWYAELNGVSRDRAVRAIEDNKAERGTPEPVQQPGQQPAPKVDVLAGLK
jgi:hypothetical protein